MTTIEIKSVAPAEGKHGPQWQLEVKYDFTQYPTKTWVEQADFPEVKTGTYDAVIEKTNQKPNTNGSHKYDWNYRILELTPQSEQHGSQRPEGNYDTGMAFNQACYLTGVIMAAEWIDEGNPRGWPTDRIIGCINMLRQRLYHEVLVQVGGDLAAFVDRLQTASNAEDPLQALLED